ncbi:TPM domain-containing protein [Candidatus Gracilibacteria bacterium]|nr:TPM domain-containing protein [Candidatus Gracilibacteria bacterium]
MNPLNLPKLTKYINDFSDIFTVEQIEAMSQIFIDHENTTTEQVVTVFISHREGNELLDIGLKIFNENGIGQKNLNNGILLIVATEEKKLRIIVGKGLELKYTEMICREIIENQLRPLLNEGKYEKMIQNWGEIINNSESFNKISKNVSKNKMQGIILMIGVIILGLTLSLGGAISNIVFGIFSFILGLGSFYGGLYFLKNNMNEARGTRMIASIIIFGLGSFFIYFGFQSIRCQFNISSTCIVWNTQIQSRNTEVNYYGNGNSSSSDWSSSDSSSSSDFGGGGGSSNGGGYGD